MSEDARAAMQRAYDVGDHVLARKHARELLADGADAETRAHAERILTWTEPDRFLTWVGLAGLGLTAWLVYNYVL